MTTRPEALLEAELVAQLRGMGYGEVAIQDDAGLLANLKAKPTGSLLGNLPKAPTPASPLAGADENKGE